MTDVLWVTSVYPWIGNSVAGVFFGTQARALARLGLAVTVAAPLPLTPWPAPRLRDRWREYASSPRRGEDHGVRALRPRFVNVPGQPDWARPDRSIAGSIWRARGEWAGARVIHGHYAVSGLAAWRLGRRARLPHVLTFHGDDLNVWPEEHPRRVDDLRAAARDAGAVVTVSQALGELLVDLTGVAAVHIPLGIDHAAIAATALPRAEARRRLGLPQDRIVVLMVGYLLEYKGARLLADAVMALGEPYLALFVGDGPLLGYGADRPGATGLLDYRGQQPHDRVGLFLSAADALVLPSTREGLPTVLVEAGSLAVPVIASGVGGIPALLADGRGTLLPALSTEALIAELERLAAEPDTAAEQGRRLMEHVRVHYDVDRNASRLLECYRTVVPDLGASR